jgi:hypothetical protein
MWPKYRCNKNFPLKGKVLVCTLPPNASPGAVGRSVEFPGSGEVSAALAQLDGQQRMKVLGEVLVAELRHRAAEPFGEPLGA